MAQIEEGIEPTRIDGSCDLKLDDLQCVICKKIVRNVVTCKNCGALFCSSCVLKSTDQLSEKCVNGCETFVQTQCHRFITEQLARLNIVCINQARGCNAIIHYDDLEKHEIECEYQLQECHGCHELQLKKDLNEHIETCQMIEMTCSKCDMRFTRGEATSHTECQCLIEQLRKELNEHKLQTAEQFKQIQQESKTNEELRQLRDEFDEFRRQVGDQIKQIVELNYKLQEKVETNKQQTNQDVRQLQQHLQHNKQELDAAKVQRMIKTIDLYKKADIRCSCGGHFCRRCGGCRDWKRDGKDWKRISDGCRFHPNTNAVDVCQCN
ncbi:hypothetical protein I4U23_012282 [Adineta vaga]|nr:hypothetical protein I4U23_012282 [Adineta vaga]